MSPALFNLYINDLLYEMNKTSVTYGFADDIVAVVSGEANLLKTIKAIEIWSQTSKIEVNKKKSAILIVRKDERTPLPILREFEGYPILTNYKYLGIHLQDSLKFDIEKKSKEMHESKLKKI